ncbi:hypothetical protein SASPL_135346 [Salvia splendens]|uniref:Uncharacterized protein n=1 Tax=Salvia splendens TaxID=180675 RepID=A0A8X8WYL9_SALSN|nr:uncharacterized protein LOC121762488 [Salvia splendens]KAG6403129.1 hypothetical protein SASPL_135346 [Salvia splendens]
MKIYLILIQVLLILQLCGYILCKECTNIPTQSHTLRYQLLTSKNETWKHEMLSHHVTPTDDSVWSSLFPRKMLQEEDEHSWGVVYRKIKNSGGAKGLLSEVSLHDVRLDPKSMHGRAQQTNLDYLLILDVDRLVWSFRKTAALDAPGSPYGGWESPDMELRGHFVGHYLSACAQMWASTHNESLKQKMNAVVSALSACQQKMGTGYLSAFPLEFFDRFEAIKPVWAPYYTIHKILAGLLDQYSLGGNGQALKMSVWMVDYFYNRVQNVIAKYTIERHWTSLNEETGGMNDALYRLYSITGDQKHLTLGHLFDKPCFLGMLAIKADSLSGFHANTHIPVVVGSQMRFELTGDPLYKEIGTFFMDTVNSSHTYATGGTSVSEFWSDPKRLAGTLQTENEESCTTYNMLKVSRNLFRWTKEMAYADYYERALTNGVLSIQRGTEPGVMIYMLPLGPGTSKAHTYHKWGTKFDSFWCCYGTGIESFSKLGDSIYFEEGGNTPTLYIIQYISSSLNWKSGNIILNQQVEQIASWDPRLQISFTFISSKEQTASGTSTLNFRIPLWTYSKGAKATLNGQNLPLPSPGSFLSVSRSWSRGDSITIELPISLRTEAIKDDRQEYASLQAIFYGPYLLAGLTQRDWDINAKSATSFSDWLTPLPSSKYNSQLISLSQGPEAAILFVSNTNNTLKMASLPEAGTDTAVSSTFRLILKDTAHEDLTGPWDAIDKSVVLEPFDLPGMAVVHHGEGKPLGVVAHSAEADVAVFRLVKGLDGKDASVSMESEDKKGCYVCSGGSDKSSIKLSCISSGSSSDDDGFKQAASFTLRNGFNEYHPISFVAKGMSRNFLLSPLLSLTDESYTVYFNIHS